MCGLPNIDVDDWRRNTEYKSGYSKDHPVRGREGGETELEKQRTTPERGPRQRKAAGEGR
jgi:hypothetical protein